MTAAELARRLGARRVGRDWRTSCPLHDDRDPSLDFRDGDKGGIVYACRSRKCDSGEIHRHFRERYPDLFGSRSDDRPAPRRPRETRYRICDAAGVLVAVHVRQDFSYGSPKRFSWERPDGTRGLNGIPTAELPLYGSEHLAQLRPDAGVIVCEGRRLPTPCAAWGCPPSGL